MFVVVSLVLYVGWTIGKFIGKTTLVALFLIGWILYGLLKAVGKILSLVFKYTYMAALWGYAKVVQIYQNHKMIKEELGTFGFLNPFFLGLLFNFSITCLMYPFVIPLKSVSLGIYCLMSPFMFSMVPFSQDEYGCAK